MMKTKTLLACWMLIAGASVSAQEIGRLYAPQAPAGSIYLRVLNASDKPLRVEFGNKQDVLDARKKIATDYRVVNPGVTIKVDGRALEKAELKPDSFYTIVLGAGDKPLPIADATAGRNDLKAELRFYNLARDCNATLALQDGANVFERIAYQGSAKRSINPVRAQLLGRCESGAASAAVPLPSLKSGDHASLFLIGDGKNPRLVVQIDATEPYTGAR